MGGPTAPPQSPAPGRPGLNAQHDSSFAVTDPIVPVEPELRSLVDDKSGTGSSVGDVIRDRAGDASSVLSIAGAAALLIPHPNREEAKIARVLVASSLAAGGVDTAIQGTRAIKGSDGSDIGTTAYAATGLLPSASVGSLAYAKQLHNAHGRVALATLGANLGLIGYEMVHRIPRMKDGKEDTSGYLSFAAAFSGIAVRAHR